MKLFLLLVSFLILADFFSKFVKWLLVAGFEFPINQITDLLSPAISSIILSIVFALLALKLGLLK